ncbi:MAG: flavin reductase family protein [Anaerolineales bacterium]|nr:flavin reductase family protein [Anaerolineales bacterium]
MTKLDSEQLRAAMRSWSAGVTVVTAAQGGQFHGMTVNSFTSISLDPALIIIALQNTTRTHEFISAAQAFGVTILSKAQTELSDLFAGRRPAVTDRFAEVQTETLITGAPFIVGGLAWFDCRVLQSVQAGVNTLFIAEVVAAQSLQTGDPLIYHNRAYWSLTEIQ